MGKKIGVCEKMKTCDRCGSSFEPIRPNQLRCSKKCILEARRESSNKASALLNSQRIFLTCEICKNQYEARQKRVRRPGYIQQCNLCKRGQKRTIRKVISGPEKSYKIKCSSCEWAIVTKRTDTGFLCTKNALVCNPHYAARLYEAIVEGA